MATNFTELMSSKSDEQLLKIIARPGDYQTEALDAARREISRRNLSADRLEEARKEVVIEEQRSTEKANMPLEGTYKALSFFFPGFIPAMMSTALRTNGYEKKASDMLKWTFYGVGFYITLIVFFSLLN